MSAPTTTSPIAQRSGAAYARLALTIALALYSIPLSRHPEAGSLLDSVDLAIHETGHLVFGPFGEVIGFAGGTLSATVPLWWIAQNCWNISVYIRDARTQELPLVGGGEHDWAFLLGRFGLLAHDQGIGRAVFGAGMLVCLCAITSGIMLSMRSSTITDGE
jgi:hypothetical protein